jgi:hypothetical protein
MLGREPTCFAQLCESLVTDPGLSLSWRPDKQQRVRCVRRTLCFANHFGDRRSACDLTSSVDWVRASYSAKVSAEACASQGFEQAWVAPFLASGFAHANEDLGDVFGSPICVGVRLGSNFATDAFEENLLGRPRTSKIKTGLGCVDFDNELATQQLKVGSLRGF